MLERSTSVAPANSLWISILSIAWMVDGWLEGKASLLIENAVLSLINIAGFTAGCRAHNPDTALLNFGG